MKIGLVASVGLCIVLAVCMLAKADAMPSENKSSPDYWTTKGSDLMDAEKYDEAARYFTKALGVLKINNVTTNDPQYIEVLHARGIAYLYAQEYNKAESDLLIAANSENLINSTKASDYYLEAAIVNNNIGYRDSAYNMLIGSAIRANPKNANAWYMRGMYFSSLNKYKQAAEYFSKARELGYDGEVTTQEEEAIEMTVPIE
jgi:tetratricopeptide (TPR) repeat protein